MIPPEVAARVRLLAQELQPEAATPRVEAVHRIRPADAVQSELPRELQQGAIFRATIQRPLPDGTFVALVAGREMTLAIDRALKSGDTLELVVTQRDGNTLLARETSVTQVSGNSSAGASSSTLHPRQDSTTVSWSRTGALLQQLMTRTDASPSTTEVRIPPASLTRTVPLPQSLAVSASSASTSLPQSPPTSFTGASPPIAAGQATLLASMNPNPAGLQLVSASGPPLAPSAGQAVMQPPSAPGGANSQATHPSVTSAPQVAASMTSPAVALSSASALSAAATPAVVMASHLSVPPTIDTPASWESRVAQVSQKLVAQGAPLPPEVLNAAVRTSGLFYESHLAKWISGSYPLEALRLEPQNLALAGTLAVAAASSRAPSASAAPSTTSSNERVTLLLRQLFGGTSSASESPTGASHPSSTATPIPDRLVSLVQQQLDALANQRFEVSFTPWAGAQVRWLIEKEPQPEEMTDDEQRAKTKPNATPRWRSRLKLDSPILGTIECHMTFFSPTEVHLAISAHRSDVARALQGSAAQLLESLRFDGIQPSAIQILTERTSGA